MRFQPTSSLLIASLYLSISIAVPFMEPNDPSSPIVESLKLDTRDAKPEPVPSPRNPPPPPSPPPPPNCPPQKPIAQNLCNSGSPYCCSGSGASQVCGPAASVSCASTTICCINTNGMQICAGEIDFTGPVTININVL